MATKKAEKIKVTVVREFIDRTIVAKEGKEKAYRKVGSTFEVDEARAAELEKGGYVKLG